MRERGQPVRSAQFNSTTQEFREELSLGRDDSVEKGSATVSVAAIGVLADGIQQVPLGQNGALSSRWIWSARRRPVRARRARSPKQAELLRLKNRAGVRGKAAFATAKQKLFLAIALGSLCVLPAAPPPLDMLFPAGAACGTTNIVIAVGKFDSWPPKVWVNSSGLVFTAETNKGKFSVTVAADAAPGPHLVRLYNDDGASEPRIFVIDAEQTLADTEPNNHFARPQPIRKLPVTVNGRLDKNGDVDSFSIQLREGEWLEARVDSHTLMSKVDPALRLMTTNGLQLAWNHDFITLDPRLVWRAPSNQTVVLQIFGFAYPPESDIRLAGGEAAVYRLHIGVTNKWPAPCTARNDSEVNHKLDEPALLELPATIRANISRPDDEDRFRFTATKGKIIEARVEATSFGSPLDAWLKIEDGSGNELARNDDADGSRDPRVEWKVPTNGNFVVAIGSVTHRGGEDYCYRLFLRELNPDFRATLAASSLVLNTGATNEVKVEVKRLRGHTNELVMAVRDLPPGVTALATNLPQKDGTISVRLVAAADAPNFQGLVHLVVIDSVTKTERAVPFELTTRGETAYPQLVVETCEDFWLTVRPKPKETEKPAAKK